MRHIQVGYEVTKVQFFDIEVPDDMKDTEIENYLDKNGKFKEFHIATDSGECTYSDFCIDDLDTKKTIVPWEDSFSN